MNPSGMQYEFSAKVYHYSTSPDMTGWTIVSLPKEIANEIRDNFKFQEQGWGRMQARAQIAGSQWQTAIWFDTKQDTYLLPIKAAIRKKEKITPDQIVEITLWV